MFYVLLITRLAERDNDCEVCNNNFLHASVCNKTFKVDSGDWIHTTWLAQGQMISNKDFIVNRSLQEPLHAHKRPDNH